MTGHREQGETTEHGRKGEDGLGLDANRGVFLQPHCLLEVDRKKLRVKESTRYSSITWKVTWLL